MSTPIAQFSRPQELPREVNALVFMCTDVSVDKVRRERGVLVRVVTNAHPDRSVTNVGNFHVTALIMVGKPMIH